MKMHSTLATLLVALSAGAALAQESGEPMAVPEANSAGEAEFMNSCAVCHGTDGKDDTELSRLLTIDVPDLTRISAENDGEFPMRRVIDIIDGRTGVRGHGGPMPIWGNRFAQQAGDAGGPYATEVMVRGRVLALAEYLQSIQE